MKVYLYRYNILYNKSYIVYICEFNYNLLYIKKVCFFHTHIYIYIILYNCV